jgi:succinoglycan biosynthesis transport protein ExoP
VTRPPNTYLLQISYRSEDPRLAADAANAIAQSYLEHTYNIRIRSSASLSAFMERQLEELKAKMERSGQALAKFERDLSVVNPEEKTNILATRLLQLNADFTSAQGDRLKQEAAYDSVKDGSLDAALATPLGEPLRKLAEHVNDARENLAGVESFYGSKHPEYRRAQAKLDDAQASFDATRGAIVRRVQVEFDEAKQREDMAQQAVSGAKTEFDQINARSFEYLAAKREADADKTLYEELMRRIKEAAINAGFQNSAIRIDDLARPALKPVFPDVPLNLLLALLFSALLAVAAAVLSDMLDKTIRDPEQAARTLRTEVIGSLPLMKTRPALAGGGTRPGQKTGSKKDSEDDLSGFHESVRALRNSILLGSFDRRYRSLLITSAGPGEGKTTTASNLATAHAEQGNRTLLIDGDLRRPSVHRNFNLPSVVGLSNALMGEVSWREARIHVQGTPNLDILPAGPPSRRAADLVGRGLTELLEEAASEYDLVVLDAPPLLGFAEPLQMATAADGVLVVARAGQTSRKAVATVLATLARLRARVVGVVLNEVHPTPTQYAFHNQTMLSDAELLQRFHFERSLQELADAAKKTIEIMRLSPYQKTANAGLFLKALDSRGPSLPRLLAANIGNQVANQEALSRLADFAASAPELDETKIEQIAALPLGSRVKLNPWDNRIELVKTKPLALLSAREKMPFEVTPFVLHLTRVAQLAGAAPAQP